MNARPELEPLFGLTVTTPRLQLRLPSEDDLAELARLAIDGVHAPDAMPFLVPWTDNVGDARFPEEFADYHRSLRAAWAPEAWQLELGVWADGRLIGTQGIHAENFAAERTVQSGSWLGLAFQGNGYGTEMRSAVLDLAFFGLGAVAARTTAFDDNIASATVSRKLGYREALDSSPAFREGIPLRPRILFTLTREEWEAAKLPRADIAGLAPCLELFGV
jgi:RimJ/RimL family protein N-acetyltransferase